jgi:hypothetical protein
MDWIPKYHREQREEILIYKNKIRKEILHDLKKKHIQEKKDEIEILKKRLSILEKELIAIEGLDKIYPKYRMQKERKRRCKINQI